MAVLLDTSFFVVYKVYIFFLLCGIFIGTRIYANTDSDLREIIEEIPESISELSWKLSWDISCWCFSSWSFFVLYTLIIFVLYIAIQLCFREGISSDTWLIAFFYLSFLLGIGLGIALYLLKRFWRSQWEKFAERREWEARKREADQVYAQKDVGALIEMLGESIAQDYVVDLLANMAEQSCGQLINTVKNYSLITTTREDGTKWENFVGRHQIVGAAKALRKITKAEEKVKEKNIEPYLLIAEELDKGHRNWQSLIELGEPALGPLRELWWGLPEKVNEWREAYDVDHSGGWVAEENLGENPERILVDGAIKQIIHDFRRF